MIRLRITCLLLALAPAMPAAGTPHPEVTVAELAAAMQRGETSARAVAEYYLERIEAIDRAGPTLRSIIEINPDALEIADELDRERRAGRVRGPLHGVPVVLKANIDTGDRMATSAGSLALAGHRAPDDAFLVARLREAGAVLLAKANLSEWANFRSSHSSSGWSSAGGQTGNAYDPRRNPCGSSSGSAVAVSANLTMLAIGTETDGSIICPSATNGIVGIKPTLGLVSRDGIIPIAHSQDTAGPMARSVRDAALLLDALVAADATDPATAGRPAPPRYAEGLEASRLDGRRIGVLRSYGGAGSDPRVERIFEQAIATLVAGGAEIVDPIEIDTQGMDAAEYEVLLYEFKADLNRYLEESSAPVASLAEVIAYNERHAERVMPFFGQDILEAADDKGSLDEQPYRDALVESKRIARTGIDGVFEQHGLDALIAPSNGPAWLTDHVLADRFTVGSSSFAAVSGYANVTVPAGSIHGLPIGLSFIGTAFSERRLLEIAWAFEQATRARRVPDPGAAVRP